MRAAALLCALSALCVARCAGAWGGSEPPWASPAARAAADASARDAPASFVVLTRPGAGAQALADVCNRTRLPWLRTAVGTTAPQPPPPASRPSLACRLQLGGACRHVFTRALTGLAGTFRPSQLRALHACLPDLMAAVEHDAPVQRMGAPPPQPPPAALGAPQRTPWNLDRLDQRATPLDGTYAAVAAAANASLAVDGAGVAVYVLDSGIRGSHIEFAATSAGGRSRVVAGFDFVAGALVGACADCDGHGTHVAATAAGLRTGVAPGATLHCVRVLDCAGSGRVSDVVAGLDWVAAHAARPAVATLSLGVPRGDWSAALEAAVRGLVRAAGVFVAVAAGNSGGADACAVSPASVPDAFTVGASDLAPRFRADGAAAAQAGPDTLYSWGDTGPCLDLFAPGTDILSACGGASRCANLSDAAYARASGTSMAAPHVAGVAALLLQQRPTASPADVAAALIAAATPGRLQGKMQPGTPNLLLYARASPPPLGAPLVAAAAGAAGEAAASASQSGAVAKGGVITAQEGLAPEARAFANFEPIGR